MSLTHIECANIEFLFYFKDVIFTGTHTTYTGTQDIATRPVEATICHKPAHPA